MKGDFKMNHKIVMKKFQEGQWNNIYPETITTNVFNDEGETIDNLLNDITTGHTTDKNLQNDINQNTIKRFDNITVDLTQPPYNVPTNPSVDATPFLQNALDTVPIRSRVLLPKGTYTITKPLIISRELTVEGSGSGENGGTLIDVKFGTMYAENYAIVMKSSAKNGRLKNIYLRNSTADFSGLFGIGVPPTEPALTHYEFENIWSVGFTAGFHFNNIYLSTFRACYAVGGYYGFKFNGHSTSLIFEKCYANKNTDNWYIENIVYSTFLSCASDDPERYGYYINNVDSVSFISCGIEGGKQSGFYMTDSNSVSIVSFFAAFCGKTVAPGIGASAHIDASNKGVVINGFFEYELDVTSTRKSSIVFTSGDNASSLTGAVVTEGIYTTPNITVNGQKRSNVLPANGTHVRGDFVYNIGSNDNLLGWKCITGGTPGNWLEVLI